MQSDIHWFKAMLFCIGLVLIGTSGAVFIGLFGLMPTAKQMSSDLKEITLLLREQTELMKAAPTKTTANKMAIYPVCRVQRQLDTEPWNATMDQLIMGTPLYLDSLHWCDQAKGLPNYVVLYY